jgi:uncharacterized protein YaaQ
MPGSIVRLAMNENHGIDTLVILHVTNEQIDVLMDKLNKQQFYFTRIDSSGGFLQYPNNSLLIGISRERLDDLKILVKDCCQRRTTHIATQTHVESYPHHSQPAIIEAEVGGATMQTLTVEYFEQF